MQVHKDVLVLVTPLNRLLVTDKWGGGGGLVGLVAEETT